MSKPTQSLPARFFIRNIDSGPLLELFLVSAVAAILVIRFFLHITGYPQLGGDGLHIAHMLWGGLLMLIALMLLISYITKEATYLAAFLGGVGFGTFLDEIGKFVTSDNNYFFQPAVGLMYVTFVLLILGGRAIRRRSTYSPEDYLVNAVAQAIELARNDLEESERAKARQYLAHANPANPLTPVLNQLLDDARVVPDRPPGRIRQWSQRLSEAYFRLVSLSSFPRLLIAIFTASLVLRIAYVVQIFLFPGFRPGDPPIPVAVVVDRAQGLGVTDILALASSLFSAVYVLIGVLRLRSNRLAAYTAFKTSVLITLFITQVFAFFREEFGALLGFMVNLLVLLALDYMIVQEKAQDSAGTTLAHNPGSE